MDRKQRLEEEALLVRVHSGSSAASEPEESLLEYELDDLDDDRPTTLPNPVRIPPWYPSWTRRPGHRRHGFGPSSFSLHPPRRRHCLWYFFGQALALFTYSILISIAVCGVFFPSYSHPPQRYYDLRQRVQEEGGTANVNNEKVYIAASLYDHEGELLSGDWAQSVLSLIDILGADNVFLSIYENNPDPLALAALGEFAELVPCQAEIVSEVLELHDYPHVIGLDGEPRLKRIAFLADVRNRALRPLDDPASPAHHTRFDKLLYLNDVIFEPVEAANLLLSTNVDEASGKTRYNAACAVDFINPFKFYDTFATRDLDGYDMGVPFFPWFASAGQGESRRDVLSQTDAVRVKSCWGGMVAFDAKWFQDQSHLGTLASSPGASSSMLQATRWQRPEGSMRAVRSLNDSIPLRFRSETDAYWDASECCLIHADIAAQDSTLLDSETGVYLNPYIRVAYSASVLPWLAFTKRFERLYTPIHAFANWLSHRPTVNPRQFQEPGDEVVDRIWIWDENSRAALESGTVVFPDELHGHFKPVTRTALPGGFCGIQKLLYINEDPLEGEAKWGTEGVPDVNVMI